MNVEEFEEPRPQTLMQAYRMAERQARSAENSDEKIKAYDRVINYCDGRMLCRLDQSIKKNTLMYWAYSNVAEAYIRKKEYGSALTYLGKALKLARSHKQKNETAARIAALQTGKVNENSEALIQVLENALNVISHGRLSVAAKCRNVLEVCKRLKALYKLNGDEENVARIQELAIKTSEVLKKSLRK